MDDIKAYKTPIWLTLAAIVGLFILYFAQLGSYPLTDPDEPIYGQIAKEMAQGGDWLTPHYDGQVWFDKPPMYHWLAGACISVLGPTELACRLPSAVLAVALVLILYAFVSYDFGRRVALLSAVIFATCIQMVVLARAAVADVAFTTCLFGALYAYRRWFDSDGRARYGWMALCGVSAGLGMLVKGPISPFLLFLVFVVHLCWTRRTRRLISWDALLGVVAALAVGVPWFAAMYTMHHEIFVKQFIEFHNIDRYTKPLHPGTTGQWYSVFFFVPVFFLFFFPWSVFLPSAIIRFARTNSGALLAAIWCAVIFLFFSFSKTKLVTYIFPTYPMAAMFIALMFDRAASGEMRCATSVKRGLIAGVVMALLFAYLLLGYARYRLPDASVAGAGMGAILLAMFVAAFLQRRNPISAVWTVGAGMTAFTALLMFVMIPSVSSSLSTRELLAGIPRDGNIGARLDMLKKPSLIFYLDRWPKQLKSTQDSIALLSSKEPAWVVCKDKEAALLRKEGYPQLMRGGNVFLFGNEQAVRAGTQRSDR